MTSSSDAHYDTAYDLASLDMAGTTVDEGGRVYQVLEATVADAARQPVPADVLYRWKGTGKRQAIVGLFGELGVPASESDVDAAFEQFTNRLIESYRTNPPDPMPGVPDMFATLRARGVKVALQTGYSAPIAMAILEGMGWTVGDAESNTVDALVTSDLVPVSRPAPYLVFRTMEAAGVQQVSRVLVGGDTPNDLHAGTNAGAGFVTGALTGTFDEAALSSAPHTHVLPSIADISKLL